MLRPDSRHGNASACLPARSCDASQPHSRHAPTADVELPACLRRIVQEHTLMLEARMGLVAAKWDATTRELDVLRLLVSGDANKEIAVKLGCSEVTVERRVTKLLRRAGCDGRGRLIAAFWTAS